jgi:hypothetical protein
MSGNTESWDGFTGANFLKASDVKDEKIGFAVTSVDVFTDDNKEQKPRLTLGSGDNEYRFDLNVTNSNICKELGIKSPKNLLGKKIFFRKINVISPKTKKEVESLRISKIE